jgi:hypothetical protein
MTHVCEAECADDPQADVSYAYLRAKFASEILIWAGIISDGSPFHLADTAEVQWLREYLMKIDRKEVSSGLLGNSFLEEVQTWLAFQLHQQKIPWHDHMVIFEQAARWLCTLIIEDARQNSVCVSRVEDIDRPYGHQSKRDR